MPILLTEKCSNRRQKFSPMFAFSSKAFTDVEMTKNNELSQRLTRRSFCTALMLGLLCNAIGCSYFKSFTKKDKEEDYAFEEDEDAENEEEKKSIFDSERKKQKEMADYVAQNGRSKDSKKKKISAGDTFLMSDKAKEIYANTER